VKLCQNIQSNYHLLGGFTQFILRSRKIIKLLNQNQNINKLSYGFAFLFMTIGAILQYITPYFNQLGKEDIGFKILILLYISIFIANSFAPYFIEKYDTKKMIITTALAYIISISSIIVDNVFIIYIGTILLGFSGAILWNSQNIYLIKISKEENIGKNSGFFVAIYSIGCAIGILILGNFIELFSYKISFLLMLFFSFIGLYLFIQLDSIKEESIKKRKETINLFYSQYYFAKKCFSKFIYSINTFWNSYFSNSLTYPSNYK